VLWLLKSHSELRDSQIMRLVGTTKPTIAQIRDRSHWNTQNLVPQDPVTLGLCTQTDLDAEVRKSAKRVPAGEGVAGGTLLPVEQSVPGLGPQPSVVIMKPKIAETAEETAAEEEARMLASLKGLGEKEPADGAGE
jgi:uncharacterized protein